MSIVINNHVLSEFLSEEQIKQRCPLAYCETPTNDNVSDKYVLANTAMVISDMEKLGWGVVDAKQKKQYKNSSGRLSSHLVIFQNPDLKIIKHTTNGDEPDCYPRLLLTNSHDGLNCFRFMVGLFRLICENGLVLATDNFLDLKIRHIYYNYDELKATLNTAIEQVGIRVSKMTLAMNRELSLNEKYEMAIRAIAIRKECDPTELNLSTEILNSLLYPIRKEDAGNSLWSTFNVLQERIIKGNFSLENNAGKLQKARKIMSFTRDIEINSQLWKMMEEYL